MIAIEMQRSVGRFLATKTLGRRAPGLIASHLAPLKFTHVDEPALRTGWVRVEPILSGICGSDLAMISGDASFYFGPIISMPFVPGHEIVGRLVDGSRVVIEPVLGCRARGIDPPCPACAEDRTGRCVNIAAGHISPGLQTGFCRDTGGGWGQVVVAHQSQLHRVPDEIPDEAAVLIEPLACAVHAVSRAGVGDQDKVLVSGAGTIGLLTIAAARAAAPGVTIIASAKHPRQRLEAKRLGADDVCEPSHVARHVRLATGSRIHEPERGAVWLSGGVDISFECAGRLSAVDTCLRVTRPGGTVVVTGLPPAGRIDPAPIWHRELSVKGAYTYTGSAFPAAIDLAGRVDLTPLLSATYPLARYAEALDHAMDAGRLDAIKIAFKIGAK